MGKKSAFKQSQKKKEACDAQVEVMCTLWEQLDMISEGYCLFEIVVSREMILSHKMKSYLWSWCRQAESLFYIYIYGSNYENILHFHSSLFFLACLLIWLVDNDFQTVFNSLTILWVFNGFGVGFLSIFRSLLYIFKKKWSIYY